MADGRKRASRRVNFAAAMAIGIAVTAHPNLTQAQQKFPTKPVRLLVGYSVGGQPDILVRMIGPRLSDALGQPVVIENRVGADGTLAAAQVARATADGHTLLFAGGNFPISAAVQPRLPYDPIKDFAGIARIGVGNTALVVAPALGVKSVKDFIALAKARPGKLIFSCPGAIGGGNHLTGVRLSRAAGIDVVTVAFKGGPEALVEVLAGRADYSIISLAASLPLIKDGQLRALAVFRPQRLSHWPDVPSIAETFPEWKASDFGFGFLAPAKTPPFILNQVSKEVERVAGLPDIREWMLSVGITPALSTLQEYDRVRREQIELLSGLARDAGIKAR